MCAALLCVLTNPAPLQDSFHAALVTPVLHYTMGGVAVSPKGQVSEPSFMRNWWKINASA
jgi:succinate dehydrogenase/fumarate reductase flavoprotein subunit